MTRTVTAALLGLSLLITPSLRAQSPGAIVAVGGGGTTPAIVAKTLELAGGKNAVVAVLPQASELPTTGASSVKMWTAAGARSAQKYQSHGCPILLSRRLATKAKNLILRIAC